MEGKVDRCLPSSPKPLPFAPSQPSCPACSPQQFLTGSINFIQLFALLIVSMGADSSTTNQNEGQFVSLDVSAADRERVERSKNKPSPKYAKLATTTPTLLPAVETIRRQETKNQRFSKTTDGPEVLPLYQMVAAPSIFYLGGWENGKQHGKGEVFTKSGVYFSGEFNYGTAECSDGLVVFPDGSFYRGAFVDNQFQGQGRFVSAVNQTTYEGQWRENHPHGKGKESYQDKSYYDGEWVDGLKHGKGFFNWGDGKVYNGGFEAGEMHGEGELFYPGTDSKFKGRFERGQKVTGSLVTKYGHYEGKFQFGQMHDSRARFTWKDGKVYEGGFEFGQMHGRGRLTFPNGNVVSGQWERGENVLIENLGN